MTPEIKTLEEKKLVGMRIKTTVANDKARELWQRFMPRRNEVRNRVGENFYSIQAYDHSRSFETFTPQTEFEKWASVEVSDWDAIPDEMESRTLAGGQYAVFIHRGLAKDFPETWKAIFMKWLPQSDYELDKRDHFEILTPAYRPDDPDATEEIWIPIK